MGIDYAEKGLKETEVRPDGHAAAQRGVGYGGKTLKEMLAAKDRLTSESGHYYGLKELPLNDKDPITLTRFHARLGSAAITARETAKWMAGSPTLRTFGECLWVFAAPEGDVVAASLGLAGHVGTTPWIIRNMIEFDFEGKGGIRDGDIFFCNDARYGAGHPGDCYNIVPIFYQGDLVGWGVGINHITDIGAATTPGSLASISPTVFCDGFVNPPMKIGENFQTAQWWDRLWMTATRTGTINVLDDKARTAGAMMIRAKVLEIIEEFGVDYYKEALREIMERERRTIERTILTETVPGVYAQAMVAPTYQKGFVWWLPEADRNWISHLAYEFEILRDGRLVVDFEGTSSEEPSSYNAWVGTVWCGLSWWFIPYVLRDTASVNTAILYQVKPLELPRGSIVNPTNPLIGQANAILIACRLDSGVNNLWCRPRYARGIVEECAQSDNSFSFSGVGGTLSNGVGWAFSDWGMAGVQNTGGRPYKDGETWTACVVNPQSDAGEVEEWDLYQPPLPTISKGVVVNSGGHGKFRGGSAIYTLQLVYRPGKAIVLSAISGAAPGHATSFICGASGGYPGATGFSVLFRDTNMMDLIAKGEGYPGDLEEIWRWIDEGKLKTGSIVITGGDLPATGAKEGDLFLFVGCANSGWGDPLERDLSLVENDLNERYITADIARLVYGVAAESKDGEWQVNEAASAQEREEIRRRRREKAVPFQQFWQQERERIAGKAYSGMIADFHKDLLKWGKSRSAFVGTWQLGEDYQV